MKKPLLSELTLREKIGQMLLPYQYDVYYADTGTYPDNMRTEEEVKAYIEKEQFGTYYMEQTAIHKIQHPDLTDSVSKGVFSAPYKEFVKKQIKYGKIPALTGGDYETEGAGHVFSDLSVTCRTPAIGAADSEELTYELARSIAKELRTAGINWRWAPCVDIGGRYSSSIMRVPCSDDVDRLIKLTNAQIRGTQDEGVVATAKHFPGGGYRYEARDSHFCPSANPLSLEQWWAEQGKIFQAVIDAGVYSIMISHKSFPAVDDSKLKGKYRPATASKKVITDLLKNEMGFKGVVITDGLVMAGLIGCFDTYEDLIVDVVNAGNDCLLAVYPSAGDIIENAVKDGRIPESRIDDACQRMLDLKEKIGLFEEGYWDPPYTAEDVVPHTREINRQIAKRAITKVCDRQNLLPVDKSKVKNVTIVCSTHVDRFLDDLQCMKKCFEDRGMNVRLQRRVSSDKEMQQIDETSDLIIFAAYVAPHQPKGFMTLYDEECNTYLYAFSRGREKSIGVSMGYPHMHFEIMGNADTFINTYGTAPELMEAFVEGIFGEIPIVGNSPVQLYPDHIIRRADAE